MEDDTYVLPRLTATLALGSSILRGDVVPLSAVPSDKIADISNASSIGQPEGMRARHLPRFVPYFVDWNGKLDDGTYAPNGDYKIVFRALRVLGDAENEDDWDTVETGPFYITYAD